MEWLRSFLPELGGEKSCCHLPTTRCPKQTDHLPVCLDARGLIDSLGHLASSRSRSKRQNVSCAKSLRTIFVSEFSRFDRYGWSCEKYQRIPIEIVYPNMSHKLFVSNSYSCFSLTAPCSFCQAKHSTTFPWSRATMVSVEILMQCRSGNLITRSVIHAR